MQKKDIKVGVVCEIDEDGDLTSYWQITHVFKVWPQIRTKIVGQDPYPDDTRYAIIGLEQAEQSYCRRLSELEILIKCDPKKLIKGRNIVNQGPAKVPWRHRSGFGSGPKTQVRGPKRRHLNGTKARQI